MKVSGLLRLVLFRLLGILYFIRKYFSRLANVSDKAFYYMNYSIPTGFISGKGVDIYGTGDIVVGNGSYIGNNSAIQLSKGEIVEVGRNVSISHNVRLYTSSRISSSIVLGEEVLYKTGSIRIGDNVWVGANVVILPGVEISSNVVIGANSVVTKSLLESCVYAGIPAKKIG